LDVVQDSVVEIGIVAESGACFATVVRPPSIPSEPECSNSVHGIPAIELQAGPDFATSFVRMVAFLEHLQVSTVEQDSDSDVEPREIQNYSDPPPQILVVAHNGLRFDFAMLVSEVFRSGADFKPLQRWLYVDTLDVFKAGAAPCVKLQCLYKELVAEGSLRAHRALDDAIALRSVAVTQAERYGIGLRELFAPFIVECDVEETMVQEKGLRLARNIRD
jgi:DNA polymerase III epsilon subunit-like protein